MKTSLLTLAAALSVIISLSAQAASPTGNIHDLATQAGDVYAGMFHNVPNEDEYIKQSLLSYASMSGFTTAAEIRLFLKIGLDEAHKQSAALDEAT
jgi:hypothetical protein